MSNLYQSVHSVCFIDSGTRFFAVGEDYGVHIFSADSGERIHSLLGNDAEVTATSTSLCGRFMATGAKDGTVRLFYIESGSLLRILIGHDSWVWALSFSPDGQHVYSAGRDGHVRSWYRATGDLVADHCHPNEINDLVLSPDGQILATACDDGLVRLLGPDLSSRSVLAAHKNEVWSLAFLDEGRTLVSSDIDGAILLWDTQTEEWHCLAHHPAENRLDVGCIELSSDPTSSIMAFARRNGEITVRHASGDIAARVHAKCNITSVALCAVTGHLVAGSTDGSVILWNLLDRSRRDILPRQVPESTVAVGASDGVTAPPISQGTDRIAAWPPSVAPPEIIDKVTFSVTSPPAITPGTTSVIDVWAHLDQDRAEVLRRATQAANRERLLMTSRGPIRVSRGRSLTVRLSVPGLIVPYPEEEIFWDCDIGNAAFLVEVPDTIDSESVVGTVEILAHDMQISRLHFRIFIGGQANSISDVTTEVRCFESAFASYASADRFEVLGRVQGMQKILPDLNIFLDVVSLRSGDDWAERLVSVIPEHDVFYLFWSKAAQASEWVEREWRCALEKRGLDFIDPVPLVSPESVPPPPELSNKHFGDWTLPLQHWEMDKRQSENAISETATTPSSNAGDAGKSACLRCGEECDWPCITIETRRFHPDCFVRALERVHDQEASSQSNCILCRWRSSQNHHDLCRDCIVQGLARAVQFVPLEETAQMVSENSASTTWLERMGVVLRFAALTHLAVPTGLLTMTQLCDWLISTLGFVAGDAEDALFVRQEAVHRASLVGSRLLDRFIEVEKTEPWNYRTNRAVASMVIDPNHPITRSIVEAAVMDESSDVRDTVKTALALDTSDWAQQLHKSLS